MKSILREVTTHFIGCIEPNKSAGLSAVILISNISKVIVKSGKEASIASKSGKRIYE
jgi:hypothetical protein